MLLRLYLLVLGVVLLLMVIFSLLFLHKRKSGLVSAPPEGTSEGSDPTPQTAAEGTQSVGLSGVELDNTELSSLPDNNSSTKHTEESLTQGTVSSTECKLQQTETQEAFLAASLQQGAEDKNRNTSKQVHHPKHKSERGEMNFSPSGARKPCSKVEPLPRVDVNDVSYHKSIPVNSSVSTTAAEDALQGEIHSGHPYATEGQSNTSTKLSVTRKSLPANLLSVTDTPSSTRAAWSDTETDSEMESGDNTTAAPYNGYTNLYKLERPKAGKRRQPLLSTIPEQPLQPVQHLKLWKQAKKKLITRRILEEVETQRLRKLVGGKSPYLVHQSVDYSTWISGSIIPQKPVSEDLNPDYP